MYRVRLYICFALYYVLRWFKFMPRERYDLVIIRSDAIGDFIIWKNALDAYVKRFEGCKILYICTSANKDIAERTGYFADVIPFDKVRMISDPQYLLKLCLRLQSIKSDAVVCPAWSRHLSSDYIAGMINSKDKIASKCEHRDFLSRRGDCFYTKLVSYPQSINNEFDAITFFTRYFLQIDYHYRISDLSFLTRDTTCCVDKKYCLVSLSSSMPEKDWPIERFCEVLTYLPSNYGILLTGFGEKDVRKADLVLRHLSETRTIYNYVNKTTLLDLVRLISQSSLVLSNDSAAVHIAAACHIPSICCFHGADFGRFLPYPKYIPDIVAHPICVYEPLECYKCGYRCDKTSSTGTSFFCLSNLSSTKVIVELKKVLKTVS